MFNQIIPEETRFKKCLYFSFFIFMKGKWQMQPNNHHYFTEEKFFCDCFERGFKAFQQGKVNKTLKSCF